VSIATAKAALASVLRDITEPQPLAKVYEQAKWATSIGEMPCAILSLAPQVAHGISEETGGDAGLIRHDYVIRIWLFLGQMQTPINELLDRADQWPEALMVALADNLTLNDTVQHIGNGIDQLCTYQIGPMQWGLDANQQGYFGLRIDLPVTELLSTATGA
jgi:hypothetical protein